MVKLLRLILILAALAIGPAPAIAQDWTARASVDSSSFLVGDRITVRVDLNHPRGAIIRPQIPDTLGGFHVLERRPMQELSDTVSTGQFVFARYDSGTALLPPLKFAFSVPGDTVRRTLSTNPLLLTVVTVPVDTTQDFRDLKPPLAVPLTMQEILLSAGIILALAGAAYAAYRYWKKWRARKAAGGGAASSPARPAHVIALEQLALLKEKKLWQQGYVKEFYTEVTEILRRYFENRYAMMAMEETTDEIIAGLRRLRFPEQMLAEAERILRRADLVKFAKYQPSIPEHEEMFTVVHAVVDKTKIVVMTPVPAGETQAVAHAGA